MFTFEDGFRATEMLLQNNVKRVGERSTHSDAAQLLLHLFQILLLAGCRKQSGGVTALHTIHLDGGLGTELRV